MLGNEPQQRYCQRQPDRVVQAAVPSARGEHILTNLIRPDQRFVFLSQKLGEQRFTLHGLKHRGVTDTKGSRKRKQKASGHKSEGMVDLYDHEVPVVEPAAPKKK